MKPPPHPADPCPDCAQRIQPRFLEPDAVGWFAVYDHCDGLWTAGFDV